MRISTRGRYGLRAMLELALQYGAGPVLMDHVAARQHLSRKYLHALLTALKSAGLVSGVRGAGGGFVLARPPANIGLDEILHALEGPLSLVDCVAGAGICEKSERCPARRVWSELAEAIDDVLRRYTLADLVALDHKTPDAATGDKAKTRSRKLSRQAATPRPKPRKASKP